MNIIEQLKDLVSTYNEDSYDDEDFFEGADISYKKQKPVPQPEEQDIPRQQALFERQFTTASQQAAQTSQPVQRPAPQKTSIFSKSAAKQPVQAAPAYAKPQVQAQNEMPEGSLFGNFGKKQSAAPRQGRNVQSKEPALIMFYPKGIEEARDAADHIRVGNTLVMSLDGLGDDAVVQIFHFVSGIAFALGGKVQPVSMASRTYFVLPPNRDVLGAAVDGAVTGGGRL